MNYLYISYTYFRNIISSIYHLLLYLLCSVALYKLFTMVLNYFINLIFIFVLNVLFFVSGICLNSLVILSFWRSSQLRKKLCYFMIMVLSCCDLLAVLTNNSFVAVMMMFWLTGKFDVYPRWAVIPLTISSLSIGFSFGALLVMNFERYLAAFYPIFHRTSVTRGKLLILFAIWSIFGIILELIHLKNFISSQTRLLIFVTFLFPPMIVINYKLFIIARKSRRNNEISPEIKKTVSLKNISSCLLAAACLLVLSIPASVSIGLTINSKGTAMLSDANIARFWNRTFITMNSTCNCLIFYWKNKILRTEGMKLIKGMKLCRRFRSLSEDY